MLTPAPTALPTPVATSTPASAPEGVYHVAPDGDAAGDGSAAAPWDLETANRLLQAGETALLHGGDYTTIIQPANSGSRNAPIRYLAITGQIPRFVHFRVGLNLRNAAYIVVDGIEVLDAKFWIEATNASYVTIRNAHFHNEERLTSFSASHIEDAKYVHIHNCIFENSAGDSLRFTRGHHHLITNNHFDTAGHDLLTFLGVQHSIIRGNYFYNPIQKDIDILSAWEGDWEKDGSISDYLLIEANEFALARASRVDGMDWAGIQWAGNHSIIRNNVFHDTGLGIDVTTYGDYPRAAWYNAHNRIYNNTFYRNGYQSIYGGDSNGAGVTFTLYIDPRFSEKDFREGFIYGDHIFVNNLFYRNQAMVPSAPRSVQVVFDWFGEPEDHAGFYHNLFFYDEPKQPVIFVRDTYKVWHTVQSFDETYPDVASGNIEAHPRMADPEQGNFSLMAESPCVDAGRSLGFTTEGGEGTLIPVDDALYFSDGKGLIAPDSIRVGEQQATILRVDYDRNIIEITEPLTWARNDAVTLDYAGTGPDIGAFEYNSP